MGLGKRLGSTDAENPGNRIRFMGNEVFHILVLLQFFFCKGKKPVSRVREMNTLVGTDT